MAVPKRAMPVTAAAGRRRTRLSPPRRRQLHPIQAATTLILPLRKEGTTSGRGFSCAALTGGRSGQQPSVHPTGRNVELRTNGTRDYQRGWNDTTDQQLGSTDSTGTANYVEANQETQRRTSKQAARTTAPTTTTSGRRSVGRR